METVGRSKKKLNKSWKWIGPRAQAFYSLQFPIKYMDKETVQSFSLTLVDLRFLFFLTVLRNKLTDKSNRVVRGKMGHIVDFLAFGQIKSIINVIFTRYG